MSGIVLDPSTLSLQPNTSASDLYGKSNELLTATIHGQYYNLAVRGNLYHATTAVAGTTIPVMATNLVSTFTLWNPLGSGRNVVLVDYALAHTTTVTVVGDVSMYYQTGVGAASTAPGALTALVTKNGLLGSGGNAVATCYSAATLVGALGTGGGGVVIKGPILTTFGAVTTSNNEPVRVEFNGKIILPPGTLVTTAGAAAQTAPMNQSITWVELPV